MICLNKSKVVGSELNLRNKADKKELSVLKIFNAVIEMMMVNIESLKFFMELVLTC